MLEKKKKFDYFSAFLAMAKHAREAAELLDGILRKYNLSEHLEKHREDMRNVEHASDLVMYDIMHHIMQDFITPIDREDIVNIGQSMDNVTDALDEIFMFMHMYHVETLREDILEFTKLLVNHAKALERMAEEFTYFKKSRHLKERIIEISNLEKEGDELYFSAMYKLFGEDLPGKEIIIWRDLYSRLEACSDAIEHAAKAMEMVLLKNA